MSCGGAKPTAHSFDMRLRRRCLRRSGGWLGNTPGGSCSEAGRCVSGEAAGVSLEGLGGGNISVSVSGSGTTRLDRLPNPVATLVWSLLKLIKRSFDGVCDGDCCCSALATARSDGARSCMGSLGLGHHSLEAMEFTMSYKSSLVPRRAREARSRGALASPRSDDSVRGWHVAVLCSSAAEPSPA